MSTTQRLAVTGTDGTGKTTIIRRLGIRYGHRPGFVQAFRAPQYHEHPELPFRRLSAILDATSEYADITGDLGLKATVLFLQMTLFGEMERHLEETWRPRWVVSERQCLCDSLVYSKIYQPLLQAPLDEEGLRHPLSRALRSIDPLALEVLEQWAHQLPTRLGQAPGLRLWDVPLFAREVFSRPEAELVSSLQALYQARIPHRIVLLSATPQALATRLAAKSQGHTPTELHEQAQVVIVFQEGLLAASTALQALDPELRVDVIDTSDHGPADSESLIARMLEA